MVKKNRKSPKRRQRSAVTPLVGNAPLERFSDGAASKLYSFVQTFDQSTISQTATTPHFGSFVIQLSFLDNVTPFTTLFDQYRFDWCECIFRPMYTAQALTALSSVIVPQLYTVIDYDDPTPLSTLNGMREYQNLQMSELETVVRRFKPHAALAAYTGSFSGYGNLESPWIDCASSTVQHYGVKYAIDAGDTGQTALQTWNCTMRVGVSFRNVR